MKKDPKIYKLNHDTNCPYCGNPHEDYSTPDGTGRPPDQDDFIICAYCFGLSIYDIVEEQLVLRKCSDSERSDFMLKDPKLYSSVEKLKSNPNFRTYDVNIKYFKGSANLSFKKYENGRTSIELKSTEDGSVIAKATVNIPDEPLEPGQVAIKCWSENDGMLDFMIDNDIVGPVIRTIQNGYVTIPIVELSPGIQKFLNGRK